MGLRQLALALLWGGCSLPTADFDVQRSKPNEEIEASSPQAPVGHSVECGPAWPEQMASDGAAVLSLPTHERPFAAASPADDQVAFLFRRWGIGVDLDFAIYRLDARGNLVWRRCYDDQRLALAFSPALTADGRLVAVSASFPLKLFVFSSDGSEFSEVALCNDCYAGGEMHLDPTGAGVAIARIDGLPEQRVIHFNREFSADWTFQPKEVDLRDVALAHDGSLRLISVRTERVDSSPGVEAVRALHVVRIEADGRIAWDAQLRSTRFDAANVVIDPYGRTYVMADYRDAVSAGDIEVTADNESSSVIATYDSGGALESLKPVPGAFDIAVAGETVFLIGVTSASECGLEIAPLLPQSSSIVAFERPQCLSPASNMVINFDSLATGATSFWVPAVLEGEARLTDGRVVQAQGLDAVMIRVPPR